jgi:hypothetical protein
MTTTLKKIMLFLHTKTPEVHPGQILGIWALVTQWCFGLGGHSAVILTASHSASYWLLTIIGMGWQLSYPQ